MSDPSGAFTRRVWRASSTRGLQPPACVFLDAELYLDRVGAVEVLDALECAGRLPQREWIFVSSLNAEARHYDYTCNPAFGRFIAEEILPANADGKHLICGLSLSGLAGAHIALTYPQLFSGALCQSGSFWWDNERFAAWAVQRGPLKSRFWLSVGDQETDAGHSHPPTGLRQEVSQLASVGRAAAALDDLGCTVRQRVYAGGHDPLQWKAELPQALEWLLTPA